MISVCIATYNGEKYIEKELLSILPQLEKDDEIIISDDGSSDGTISIVESINDPRIVIVKNAFHDFKKKPAWNVAKNFENALSYAKGDYIFLADQDDVWMPNKVSYCLFVLRNVDLVIHNMGYYYGDQLEDLHRVHWTGQFRFNNFFLLDGKYYGCCMAFKKEVLNWCLPFPKNLLLHDYWIGILAELCGKVEFVPEPLIKYRLHDNNVSSKSANSFWGKITYRIYIIFHYLKRAIMVKFWNKNRQKSLYAFFCFNVCL